MRDRIIRGIGSGLAGVFALLSSANAADINNANSELTNSFPLYLVSSDILAANNQIGVSFSQTKFDYLELQDGVKFDSERKWITGFGVTFSLMQNWIFDNFYFRIDYAYINGQTDYTGGTFGNPSYGSLRQEDHADADDLDFRIGKGFGIEPNIMATPYLGFGHHYWSREIAGPGGYKEDYSHGYAGGGLLLQWALAPRLVFSANGLIGATLSPSFKSYDTPFAFNAALGEAVIYRTGLSVDYALARNIHVNAAVEWVGFDYGRSPALDFPRYGVFGVYEPDSRTQNMTVKIGLGYTFSGDFTPLK